MTEIHSLDEIRNDEKAEAAAALASGGVLEDSHDVYLKDGKEQEDVSKSPDLSKHETSSVHRQDEESNHERDAEDDLEAIRTTTTNAPPFTTFSLRQRKFIVFMVALGGFFSPLSANIYFPALNTIAEDFHVTLTLANLTLTSYMIFQGLAPTFFGDLADMAGRRPAYAIGFVIYIGACIGIALCDSYAGLFILRCLQSTGSSGTIALGNGVVADIATSAERGTWMGWATSGPMIGYVPSNPPSTKSTKSTKIVNVLTRYPAQPSAQS